VRGVDSLTARVEGQAADVDPPGATAEAPTRLDDGHRGAGAAEPRGRSQAREAGTDEDDVYQTPPSATVTASPLIPLASSLARNVMVAATSSAVTTRPAG
jgi:pyruvate/2-oxoglutarate dehydrogenase complex dihydrolipoamide acyltransferase (E2) component